MRNVYLSFLGLGTFNPKTERSEYRPTIYELNKNKSQQTEFVQVAEMELLDPSQFDLILIAATQKSFDAHFKKLKTQMANFGAVPEHLILEEDMSASGQWVWFEKILAYIEPGDELTVDLTHGYRAIPIVFSAAINFLQKARNITLKAVYYGVWERVAELGYAPIIDMKEFYLINEWSDAVSRLVEDADARKMGEVAEKTSEFQVGELNDPDVIRAFDDLTNTIRNVDVNNVALKANAALELIREKERTASETGKILLNLVIDKFVHLTTKTRPSGRYDRDYFRVQMEISRLLLEHKLFMQAYTVMREFIASLAMIPFETEGMNCKKRKTRRPRYGELFFKLLQYEEVKWEFSDEQWESVKQLKPYYENLKAARIEPILREFSSELAAYRNGFDHAWTARSGAIEDIHIKGASYLEKLSLVLQHLETEGFFKYS
jgi:hypothetical protein